MGETRSTWRGGWPGLAVAGVVALVAAGCPGPETPGECGFVREPFEIRVPVGGTGTFVLLGRYADVIDLRPPAGLEASVVGGEIRVRCVQAGEHRLRVRDPACDDDLLVTCFEASVDAGLDAGRLDAAGVDAAGVDAAGVDAAGIDDGGVDAGGSSGEGTNDCGSREDEKCPPETDVTGATAGCLGASFTVTVTTVGGYDAPPADAVVRTGCTARSADGSSSLQFRCIARNGAPWGDEFPPVLDDGSAPTLDPGEGCAVVGGELQMTLATAKIPFTPATVACSTAHSTGPGTTVNDFVASFAVDPACP